MTSRTETSQTLPATIPGQTDRSRGASAPRVDAAYAAQALGAGGERRGLKGGLAMLNAARNAYQQAQWSGSHDRRIPAGALTRTRA